MLIISRLRFVMKPIQKTVTFHSLKKQQTLQLRFVTQKPGESVTTERGSLDMLNTLLLMKLA